MRPRSFSVVKAP